MGTLAKSSVVGLAVIACALGGLSLPGGPLWVSLIGGSVIGTLAFFAWKGIEVLEERQRLLALRYPEQHELRAYHQNRQNAYNNAALSVWELREEIRNE